MAEIQPFHGLLYNCDRVAPADVLTQPYDKITPAMQQRYHQASPYNLIRIELGREQAGDNDQQNRYSRARDLFQSWLAEGILQRSSQPSLYWLEQFFTVPGTHQKQLRRGLIARVRLSRWDEGQVLPHEHTLSKPKADRLSLLRTVGAQQGQIFMLHPEPIPAPELGQSLYSLVDDYGVTNTLWAVTESAAIQAIRTALASQTLYIADGHHRYETALAYRDELGADPTAPAAFVMATIVDMNDPGLVVLPTHRTVSNLRDFDRASFAQQLAGSFTCTSQPTLTALHTAMVDTPHAIGLFDGQNYSLLVPRDLTAAQPLFAAKPPLWETLDVAILHVAILEALLGIDEARLREEANVAYWREADKAVAEVQQGRAQLAFFLNPTPVADVKAVADARSRMPQKSTDFFPKLLSGMVMYQVR